MNWDTALFVVVKCKIIVYRGKHLKYVIQNKNKELKIIYLFQK
jgi:hypothetical protein